MLLRATTLGLVTAGSWLHATFDEYIPLGTGLAVNGVDTPRVDFVEAFAKLHSQSPRFEVVREVEAGAVCSTVSEAVDVVDGADVAAKVTQQSVAARTNVTTEGNVAVVSAWWVTGHVTLVTGD